MRGSINVARGINELPLFCGPCGAEEREDTVADVSLGVLERRQSHKPTATNMNPADAPTAIAAIMGALNLMTLGGAPGVSPSSSKWKLCCCKIFYENIYHSKNCE